jgi:hypothetical protein
VRTFGHRLDTVLAIIAAHGLRISFPHEFDQTSDPRDGVIASVVCDGEVAAGLQDPWRSRSARGLAQNDAMSARLSRRRSGRKEMAMTRLDRLHAGGCPDEPAGLPTRSTVRSMQNTS